MDVDWLPDGSQFSIAAFKRLESWKQRKQIKKKTILFWGKYTLSVLQFGDIYIYVYLTKHKSKKISKKEINWTLLTKISFQYSTLIYPSTNHPSIIHLSAIHPFIILWVMHPSFWCKSTNVAKAPSTDRRKLVAEQVQRQAETHRQSTSPNRDNGPAGKLGILGNGRKQIQLHHQSHLWCSSNTKKPTSVVRRRSNVRSLPNSSNIEAHAAMQNQPVPRPLHLQAQLNIAATGDQNPGGKNNCHHRPPFSEARSTKHHSLCDWKQPARTNTTLLDPARDLGDAGRPWP